MTTLFQFTPSNTAPFQFQPTFDGQQYTCTVRWNLFGQRYYVFCTTLTGVPVFTLPLIGSPSDYDISITAGYFTSTLVFREDTQLFEVSP